MAAFNAAELLGGSLVNNAGTSFDLTAPNSPLRTTKTLFLYFSGGWCPPCKAFTPMLKKLYRKLKRRRIEWEEEHPQEAKSLEGAFLPYRRSNQSLIIMAASGSSDGVPPLHPTVVFVSGDRDQAGFDKYFRYQSIITSRFRLTRAQAYAEGLAGCSVH